MSSRRASHPTHCGAASVRRLRDHVSARSAFTEVALRGPTNDRSLVSSPPSRFASTRSGRHHQRERRLTRVERFQSCREPSARHAGRHDQPASDPSSADVAERDALRVGGIPGIWSRPDTGAAAGRERLGSEPSPCMTASDVAESPRRGASASAPARPTGRTRPSRRSARGCVHFGADPPSPGDSPDVVRSRCALDLDDVRCEPCRLERCARKSPARLRSARQNGTMRRRRRSRSSTRGPRGILPRAQMRTARSCRPSASACRATAILARRHGEEGPHPDQAPDPGRAPRTRRRRSAPRWASTGSTSWSSARRSTPRPSRTPGRSSRSRSRSTRTARSTSSPRPRPPRS